MSQEHSRKRIGGSRAARRPVSGDERGISGDERGRRPPSAGNPRRVSLRKEEDASRHTTAGSSRQRPTSSHSFLPAIACCYVGGVNLIDSVAQCRTPFLVRDPASGEVMALNNAADCAERVAHCPLRYVLTDELAHLCADLAYCKGARSGACADLLRAPAERLWVEWRQAPWQGAVQQYGLAGTAAAPPSGARYGMWVRSSSDGRRGLLRTFWSAAAHDVVASSVEAYFDFDTAAGEEPEPPEGAGGSSVSLDDGGCADEDVVTRCFRFRYEPTWSQYYARGTLSPEQRSALWRHALGTVALDVPMLLAFFLLLATRNGLPQREQTFARLNRRRLRGGKAPLLEHIEVRVPMLPEHRPAPRGEPQSTRVSPRLHHVRGHLVRRGGQIFWRVAHLRGSARAGIVRTRTVVWSIDRGAGSAREIG